MDSDSDSGGANLTRAESSESANSASSDDGGQLFEGAGPKEMSLLKRMYGIHVPVGFRESGESDEEEEKHQKWLGLIPGESEVAEYDLPQVRRRKSDETVRWAEGSLKNCEIGHCAGPKCFESVPLEREESGNSAISLDDGVIADDEDGDNTQEPINPKRFVFNLSFS